jgi:hypothetical protein
MLDFYLVKFSLFPWLKFLALALFLMPSLSFGQTENCSNGIDDDGDGLIDCYGGYCNGNSACKDFIVETLMPIVRYNYLQVMGA